MQHHSWVVSTSSSDTNVYAGEYDISRARSNDLSITLVQLSLSSSIMFARWTRLSWLLDRGECQAGSVARRRSCLLSWPEREHTGDASEMAKGLLIDPSWLGSVRGSGWLAGASCRCWCLRLSRWFPCSIVDLCIQAPQAFPRAMASGARRELFSVDVVNNDRDPVPRRHLLARPRQAS